jgi:protease I
MKLQGVKVLALIHTDFEDLEYWYPVYRLKEEGAEVHTVGEEANKKYIGKYGVPANSDRAFGQVNAAEYDVLLVPGGWAPDKLRRFPEVLEIVRTMNADGKVIGEICHAGWVLISAGILKGKKVTSTPGIKDDMTNAGAVWENVPVVVDGNLVSSRQPPDLPDYTRALIETILKKKEQ